MPVAPAVSVANIDAARRVIDPVFLSSPQFENDALSQLVGARVLVKVECVNPVRSFKGRGAEYFTHRHRKSAPPPWVCASAGNFGQGLGYAARKHDVPLTVFASTKANAFKIEKMRRLGADVRLVGADFDAAKDAAREFAGTANATFIEDGRDAAITEGAGTLAAELLEYPEPFDAVLVPVGNGALINGVGAWVREHAPNTRMVGAGATGAPAMERSFRERKPVVTESVSTIADGVATRVPVPESIPTLLEVTDEMLLVDDARIRDAMTAIERELGLTVEPAGAVTLAAACTHASMFREQRIALVISGSNV